MSTNVYTRITLDEHTREWYEWRKAGIGASDAPIIMGDSPYMTKQELWDIKKGLTQAKPTNYIQALGHKFEPIARGSFEFIVDADFPPCRVEHSEMPWLRASLDGFSEQRKEILEIKMVGQAALGSFDKKNPKPLKRHYAQIQHQLMVTGFDICHYYCYTLTPSKEAIEDVCFFEVRRDDKYILEELFPKLYEFWKSLKEEKQVGPIALAQEYVALKEQVSEIEKRLSQIQEELLNSSTDPKFRVGPVMITRFAVKGAVDYSKVPQLEGVNLDEYRKAERISTRFQIIRDK